MSRTRLCLCVYTHIPHTKKNKKNVWTNYILMLIRILHIDCRPYYRMCSLTIECVLLLSLMLIRILHILILTRILIPIRILIRSERRLCRARACVCVCIHTYHIRRRIRRMYGLTTS